MILFGVIQKNNVSVQIGLDEHGCWGSRWNLVKGILVQIILGSKCNFSIGGTIVYEKNYNIE